MDVLTLELKTFEHQRSALVEKAQGKYVLIHKDKVIDIFDSELAAVEHGYQQLGVVPFLVKEIQTVDRLAFVGLSTL
ncbi:MAG: hypothetical protein IH859_04215 [Chloroflexi bacterium]|nr:hypothetical protein [Chloroflexota bacterium]